MPDPFALTPDPTQTNFGVARLQPPTLPQKSVAGAMIAPISPRPTVPQAPAPASVAQPSTLDQFMQLVRTHESGGNDMASSGVANGRYQFTPATWNAVAQQHPELGLKPTDIWNGAKQDEAMRAISSDYVNVLKINGIPPTMPNMFMLHFLGEGGGPKFIKEMAANPNANAAALFPKEAQYNPTIFHDKAGQPRSLQQVYALMTKTFGSPQAKMAPIEAIDPAVLKSFEQPGAVPAGAQALAAQSQNADVPEDVQALFTAIPLQKPLSGPSTQNDVPDDVKALFGESLGGAKAGYTDAQGVYHPSAEAPKPEGKAPEVIGVDPVTGSPIFADDKENAAMRRGEMEALKGFAAGVAQDVTGPASLLPNALGGGYAERANKALSETGNSFVRGAGQIAPMLAPIGEIAGIAKTGAKALEAGESMIPSMLKGVGWGSATGALSESSNPTGKENYGERLAAKAPGMAKAGLVGAGLSAAAPGLSGAARAITHEAGKLTEFVSDIFSGKVTKAAEELRTGIDAATGKELTKEQIAEHTATIQQAAEEKVIAKQAQERKTAPPEEVGKELQAAITEDRNFVVKERKDKSGFAAAVKSDGGAPSVNTKSATNEIAAVEKKYDLNLSDLKSKLATKPDVRGGPTVRGVSIERGRDFVETLNKRIEELNSGPAHELMKVRDDFIEHMEATHPQLKTAREKYAALSRDVDPYERKGKATKAAESDLYSKEPIMDPTKVVSLLTDKTAAGGAMIKRLVERDKTGKVQEMLRQYFNHELYGSAGATKTPTVAQMTRLLENRRVALENSGLYREFEELRNERAAFENPAEAREEAVKAQHEIGTLRSDLEGARNPKQIVSASDAALKMLNRYPPRISSADYEALRNQLKDVQEHIEDHARARSFAIRLAQVLAVAATGGVAADYVGHRMNFR